MNRDFSVDQLHQLHGDQLHQLASSQRWRVEPIAADAGMIDRPNWRGRWWRPDAIGDHPDVNILHSCRRSQWSR